MDSQESIWRRLARYVSGEYASEEKAEEEAWIVDDEKRAQLADELRRVWELTEQSPAPRDSEAAWQELSEKLDEPVRPRDQEGVVGEEPARESQGQFERTHSREPRASRFEEARSRRTGRWRSVVGLAVAVLALVGVALAVLVQGWGKGGFSLEGQTFVTKAGQRATIELADGTEVQLNAESKLVLSPSFSSAERKVRLEGEAYFDVAKDTARPFLIRTNTASVGVKGTAFNVQAYPAEAQTQVAVTEGAVALHPASATAEGGRGAAVAAKGVRLEPHQVGVTAGRGTPVVRRVDDLGSYVAWTQGRLVFEDTPFEEVARRLERWYNLQIDLRLPPGSVGRLNATFDKESVDQVLKTIVAALDLRYRKEGRHIVFFAGQAQAPQRLQGRSSVAVLPDQP